MKDECRQRFDGAGLKVLYLAVYEIMRIRYVGPVATKAVIDGDMYGDTLAYQYYLLVGDISYDISVANGSSIMHTAAAVMINLSALKLRRVPRCVARRASRARTIRHINVQVVITTYGPWSFDVTTPCGG